MSAIHPIADTALHRSEQTIEAMYTMAMGRGEGEIEEIPC